MSLSGSFCLNRVLRAAAPLLFLPTIFSSARAQFETRAYDLFPEGAHSIATGDFNHDGALDKDFSEINTCIAQPLQPGTTCTASVTFDPTKTGARTASLYFNLPTGSVSPAPVAVTGTGD